MNLPEILPCPKGHQAGIECVDDCGQSFRVVCQDHFCLKGPMACPKKGTFNGDQRLAMVDAIEQWNKIMSKVSTESGEENADTEN